MTTDETRTRADEESVDVGADLVNLGFFRAAIRRSRPLWVGLALLGLVIGAGSWVSRPVSARAATTLLLTVGPEAQPGTAILNDQTIAESRGVAALARHTLGLQESTDTLLSSIQATVLTDRVLRITVTAPTSQVAVTRTRAVAAAFLTFRANELRSQQRLASASLDALLTRAEERAQTLATRIKQVSSQPPSASRQAQLSTLRAAQSQAASQVAVVKQQVEGATASAEATTAAMIAQSKVLDAASPLAQPRFKPLVLSSIVGLLIGLIIGLAVVLVRALVSDRLRRRDDVALALEAPVRLSIARRPLLRRGLRRGASRVATSSDVDRIVDMLHSSLGSCGTRKALVAVPVDDVAVAARSLLALAADLASHGASVALADLCAGAPAAKIVGVRDPGVHEAAVAGTRIHLVVPGADEIAPRGPFGPPVTADEDTPLGGERAAALAGADVVLTVAQLEPSLAGDYLHTWASDAVVFVSAGRSTWTKVHAVGELIRLAGTRLVAAVLLGADKWDETLGVVRAPRAPRIVDRDDDNTPSSSTSSAVTGLSG